MYTDYEFYKDVYEGTLVPLSDFAFYSNKVQRYIEATTQGRIQQVTDDIQLCCCELIDFDFKVNNNMLKSSESVGNWSVSYVSTNKSIDKQRYDIVKTYLSNTDLLYMGA